MAINSRTVLRKGPGGVNNADVGVTSAQVAAATYPKTIVYFNDSGKYAIATSAAADSRRQLFVLNARSGGGAAVDTQVDANTLVGAYDLVPDGRVLNAFAAAGDYKLGTQLKLADNGLLTAVTAATDIIVAYSASNTSISAAEVTARTNGLDITPASRIARG